MGRAHQDRISELPDTILLQILSLLPRKYAVQTSALSTRWKDLWKYRWPYSTTLNFGRDFAAGLDPKEFVSYVNVVIEMRGRKKVEIFQLFFPPGMHYNSDIFRWIEYAIMNGVEELYLDFSQSKYSMVEVAHEEQTFSLPHCLFTSKSLTTLSLKYCYFDSFVVKGLQFLETLYLDHVDITDKTVTKIVDGCTLLENLVLSECAQLIFIKISGKNLRLKRLVIADCWGANSVEVSAPNLHSFHYCGEFVQEYKFGNMLSLVEATMSSAGRVMRLQTTNWAEIITDIARVKSLTLCCQAVQQIALLKNSIPGLFWDLRELHLHMDLLYESNLSDIYDFFKICRFPELESLDIDLPTNSEDPSGHIFLGKSLEPPTILGFDELKTVRMKHFKGHKYEIELVSFFLEKATVLKSMFIFTWKEERLEDRKTTRLSESIGLGQLNSMKQASSAAVIYIS